MNTNEQTSRERDLRQELYSLKMQNSFLEMQSNCQSAFSGDIEKHTLQQFGIIEELVNSDLSENSKRRLVATVLKEIRDFFEESDSKLHRVIGDQDLMEDFLAERKRLAPKTEMEPSPF